MPSKAEYIRLAAQATYRVLSARANIVLLSGSERDQLLKAIAQVAAISAVASAANLSASAKASLLSGSGITGFFVIFREIEDIIAASDLLQFSLGKLFEDEVAAIDAAIVAINKQLVDVVLSSDFASIAPAKGLSDSAYASELAARHIDKRATDLDFVVDSTSLALINIAKFYFEELTSIDALFLGVGKAVSDTAVTTEDKTFVVDKYSVDSVAAAEAASIYFETSRSDTVVNSDFVENRLDKTLFDSVATTDQLYQSTSKALDDLAGLSEAISVMRIPAGGIPPQFDINAAVDQATLAIAKIIYSNTAVTDDFLGEATADDDQTIAFTKERSELLSLTEQYSVAIARETIQTPVTQSSSGFVYKTDYCDITYFSGAYVGEERIF
jgi:hypothetical protein